MHVVVASYASRSIKRIIGSAIGVVSLANFAVDREMVTAITHRTSEKLICYGGGRISCAIADIGEALAAVISWS